MSTRGWGLPRHRAEQEQAHSAESGTCPTHTQSRINHRRTCARSNGDNKYKLRGQLVKTEVVMEQGGAVIDYLEGERSWLVAD